MFVTSETWNAIWKESTWTEKTSVRQMVCRVLKSTGRTWCRRVRPPSLSPKPARISRAGGAICS